MGRLKFSTKRSKYSRAREALPARIRRRLPANSAEAKRFGINIIPGVYHRNKRREAQARERVALHIPTEKSAAESAGERYSRQLRERQARGE